MYDQTWILGKAISPLFADRVTIVPCQSRDFSLSYAVIPLFLVSVLFINPCLIFNVIFF